MGTTKSLIHLSGRPLIAWQLAMLEQVEDIRIVVGFQAEAVIHAALACRRDLTFVFNHDYLHTKTAASLALGARHAPGMVLSLDGDLLVHPDDLATFLSLDEESLGYGVPSTQEPVLVQIEERSSGQWVTRFSRTEGAYEWTGLVQLRADRITYTGGHVYELLEPHLPLKGLLVRSCEIDTPSDYDAAQNWVKEHLAGRVL
ncbi:MAG: NTP transferase domain-containing protein [Bacillota bacterium]